MGPEHAWSMAQGMRGLEVSGAARRQTKIQVSRGFLRVIVTKMITAIIINEAEIATRAHDLSNAGGTYWGRTGRVGSWRPETVQIPFRYNGIVCHLIPFLPYSTPQVSIGRGSSPY